MKLTKKQKRNCKLTEDDIYNIRREYEICHNYSLLAKQYNVSSTAIKYWVDEDHRQKALERGKNKILSEEQKIRINTNARSSRILRIATFDGYGSDILKHQKEYRSKNREKLSEWRSKNKEQINEQQKEWYSKNKEKIIERVKEYRSKNKEKVREWQKKWYHKNKDYIRQRREDNK